ncbi:hypothetical protein INR49_023345 [Caranx melampygus]|nr:hypothetical protein INR49_023345 [Caranx melampygus]
MAYTFPHNKVQCRTVINIRLTRKERAIERFVFTVVVRKQSEIETRRGVEVKLSFTLHKFGHTVQEFSFRKAPRSSSPTKEKDAGKPQASALNVGRAR